MIGMCELHQSLKNNCEFGWLYVFSNMFDKVGKIDIGNNYEDHLYHHLCEAE